MKNSISAEVKSNAMRHGQSIAIVRERSTSHPYQIKTFPIVT